MKRHTKIIFLMSCIILVVAGCSSQSIIKTEQSFITGFVAWILSDVMKYILFTPFEFFRTPTAISILIKIGIFSGGFVTLLAMIEGFKRMLSMSYTPLLQIFSRYPLALAVSAFAPTLFYYAGVWTNEVVKLVGKFASISLDGHQEFESRIQSLDYHLFESFMTFFLLIIMIFYFFKILLFHAVRWFGLLFNMMMTPVAMVAYMFKPYENVTSEWFKDTLSKFVVVIAHSFFLSLISIILYAPKIGITEDNLGMFGDSLVRILTAIGGLSMMLNPPRWIKSFFDKGSSQKEYGGMIKKGINLLLSVKGLKK